MRTQAHESPSTRARSTPAPSAGGREELLHELRNIVAGMTYGMNALAAASSRGDGQAVADLHQAMVKQVELLRSAVAQAEQQHARGS